MNFPFRNHTSIQGMGALFVGGALLLAGCGKKPASGPSNPPKAATARPAGKTSATNENVLASDSARPKAVFQDDPKVGRDPFFPNSERRVAHASAPDGAQSSLTLLQQLVLRAVFLTSPPRAFINNRSFQPGDQGVVTLPDGKKLSIKCVDIGASFAVVEIEGIPGQHKLSLGGVRR